MRNKAYFLKLLAVLISGLLIALPVVTLAQDEGEEPPAQPPVVVETAPGGEIAENEAPQGLALGILLLGLLMVAVVGIASINRENYQGTPTPRNSPY